jgi:hypothetical protein
MANPIWSLSNQKIDNRGTKVNPALTTVTPSNTAGWETLFTYSNSTTTLQYRIDANGNVGYRRGASGNQYANLQQYADSLAGGNSTADIQNEINIIKNQITGVLQTRTQNTIPSQPAPTTPTGQTPGAADAGPNSGIGSTYNVDNAPELKNELSDFGDNNNFNALTPFLFYPQNIAGTGQDRIIITQVEYVPAPITQTNISVQTAATALGNRESQLTKTKTLGYVTLPIPNDLSESNGVGWGEDSLSSITAALMSNATQFADKVASGSVQGTLGSLEKAVGNLNNPAIQDRFKRFLIVNAGASILKLGGINVNPEAYISRVTGVAINPNLELLFNGPKLRQFAFTFKMTPRSEKEAKNIRSIIKFFKKGMSPRRTTTAEKSIYLGTPNVFQMKFVSGSGGEITSIGKMKTCALVSCGVNYTPDGFYAAYSDSKTGSQPIAVVLTLGFTELTPIFSDDYDVNVEGVGPEPNLNYNVAQPTPPPRSPAPPPGPQTPARTVVPGVGAVPGVGLGVVPPG